MIPSLKKQIDKEFLEVLMEERMATPADVAARLRVSESWAVYWLTELARDGRVRILAVEAIEDGEAQIDGQPAGKPKLHASRPVTDLAGVLREAV